MQFANGLTQVEIDPPLDNSTVPPVPAVQIVQSKSDPWPRCQEIHTKDACHRPMQHQLWQVTLVPLEILGSYSPFPNQKNLIWCLQKTFTATWQSLCYRDFCCISRKSSNLQFTIQGALPWHLHCEFASLPDSTKVQHMSRENPGIACTAVL